MAILKNSPKINLRAVFFMACVTLIVFNPRALAHTDVTAEQARDLIESTNDLIVVDVREPYEYCDATGHIPGVLNYPLSSGVLQARYEELPINGPVLVVCRSGARSNTAADFLDSKGFSMVYDMLGGMNAWIWETSPCKDDSGSGTTASAQTNTYVFLPGQSTVVQTGGIAGVHWTYSVEGLFQLTVDPDAGAASFAHVDANATDDSQLQRTLDPNEVFNMTSLVGDVLDDTTISFTGKADDGSDVLITVTIENDLAYLVGQTTPPPNTADFFLFTLDAAAQRKYHGGTGEPNNPYQIATAGDLMLLGETPEDYDKHFILTADIDLDPNLPGRKVFDKAVIAPDTNDVESSFQGIPFTGVFDGNDHKISNLTVKGEDYLGLFGLIDSQAKISGLGIMDVNMISASEYEWYTQNIGGLVGANYGNVVNCNSTGNITGDWDLGGLVGYNRGSVTQCYSTGTINGGDYVGGLVGENMGDVINCYSTCSVTGTYVVGGLVGENSGYNLNGNITDCYSTSIVTGLSYVGGLVGDNRVGGVMQCYSKGIVTGNEYVGGLIGQSYVGSITASYSTGEVSGGDNYVGGLVGGDWFSDTTASFWDIQASGQTTSAGGKGKTTVEMQSASTFLDAGWDFVDETENGTDDIWWSDEDQDYPRLWWELIEENSVVIPEN